MSSLAKVLTVVLSGIVVYGSVSCFMRLNQRKIAKNREGKKFNDFMENFSGEEIPEIICFQVYSYLQNIDTSFNDFPIYPTDELGSMYGICHEDLDETIFELIDLLGYQLPDRNILRRMRPVKTVKDLVQFLVSLQQIKH